MTQDEALDLARSRYTNPATTAAYLASYRCPCERLEMAKRAEYIAARPAGRFGLELSDTLPVARFLESFIEALRPEVDTINGFIAEHVSEHGVTFGEAFIAMGNRFGEVGYDFVERPYVFRNGTFVARS